MENLVLYPKQSDIPTKNYDDLNFSIKRARLKACSVLVASVYEDQFAYQLHIMATGLKFKHFHMSTKGRLLTISAKKPFGRDEFLDLFKGKFNLNAFSRTFKLPKEVDMDHLECLWKEGVVKIRMPKIIAKHRQNGS